jgi:hypothetical protein
MQNLIEKLSSQFDQTRMLVNACSTKPNAYVLIAQRQGNISLSGFVDSTEVARITGQPVTGELAEILSHTRAILLDLDSAAADSDTLRFYIFTPDTVDDVIEQLYPMDETVPEFMETRSHYERFEYEGVIGFIMDRATGMITVYKYYFTMDTARVGYNFRFGKDRNYINSRVEHFETIDELTAEQRTTFALGNIDLSEYQLVLVTRQEDDQTYLMIRSYPPQMNNTKIVPHEIPEPLPMEPMLTPDGLHVVIVPFDNAEPPDSVI